MKKQDEIIEDGSCWNRATSNERVFILLARDSAAPVAIRAWVSERIRTNKNKITDPQIVDALHTANQMEVEREAVIAEIAQDRQLCIGVDEHGREIVGGAP